MENTNKEERQDLLPSINLPKGGGAIQSIGEKFSVNAMTGTGSASIPIPISPSRNGFAPQLGLGYDSGAGNSPFGLGWNMGVASIRRKTAKGLPQYIDSEESDTFLLAGAEDLVPFLDAEDNWNRKIDTEQHPDFIIHYYRPRTEGLFARIEKWVHKDTKEIHWKTTSKENITTYFGRSEASRIYDAENPHRIFEWLIEETHDNKGSIIRYEYKQENASGIDSAKPSEQHRLRNNNSFNQKYLKTVFYGNSTPNIADNWNFKVVLNYGEHDLDSLRPDLEVKSWSLRQDPFSNYLSGFEIRTYRLCKNILMFHHFEELGDYPVLVRSTNLIHKESAHLTQLLSASQTGYILKDGKYTSKSTPPVEYFYSEAKISNRIQSIDPNSIENLPVGVDGGSYHWVDLDGEGISGVLTEQANSWFYQSNLGNGNFSDIKQVSSHPSLIGNGRPQIQDLDGNGEKELTLLNNTLSGYYPSTDGQWENYRPFDEMPNLDWQNPNLRFLDLNGDGYADILITEDDVLRWFPSKAKKGYYHSKTVSKVGNEDDGPALIFADAEQSIYLADMSGSGMMDIMRIRNASICYWPNLGYGKFGARVIMDNAPTFESADQFNQRHIRLTDIDGSGTTDILYLGGGKVRFWNNLSGNGWSDEKALDVFPDTDSLVNVQLTDLLGKGTPCLVWSSPLPNHAGEQMKYVDLMENGKPHLMNRVVNNMGKEDLVEYLPSTHYYLKDKKNGVKWITKLHFPVYVVSKTTTKDLISNSSLSVTYNYRHGYYDGEEREFRGFGMVEQQDEKRFEEHETNSVDEVHYVPPILTRSWFHTGAYVKGEVFSDHYKTEYYLGDAEAYLLPDTVIENRDALDYVSKREACRALKGQTLRTEVYALDGSEKEEHPYSVSEINFSVRQVQPHEDNLFAVYLVHPNESFSAHYERNPADPRMSHSIVLETDKYGVGVKSAEIAYPRRTAPTNHPEQEQLHIVTQESTVVHVDKDKSFYVLGVPWQQKGFEITGVQPDDRYFSAEELREKLNNSKELGFSDIPTGITSEKRLISWAKSAFWNEGQTEVLPHGEVAWPILPHSAKGAVFTQDLIDQVYGADLSKADIEAKGKYVLELDYWWNPGTIQFFKDADSFYLPFKTMDPWGLETEIEYDQHIFIPVKSYDPLRNKTEAFIDYRTLAPKRVIDVHGNIAEAIADELGMVIATSVHGLEETDDGIERKGDADIEEYQVQDKLEFQLDDIVVHPEKYLQGASSYFYYDIDAYINRQDPPQFISLARDTHVSDIDADHPNSIHISLGYSDGFGRELQQKVKVEPGIAYISDGEGGLMLNSTNGKPVKEHSESRWLSSGRTIFNNKEKPYKQYEPFYISDYRYEKEKELTKIGVTPIIHYDPMMRVVRTDTPNGFFSKVEFSPWEMTSFDLNDTVKDSENWQRLFTAPLDPEQDKEREALTKAAKHYNTPSKAILDSLGRAFMAIGLTEEGRELITHSTFEIAGKPLTQTDPRQYELNKTRLAPVHNFLYTYDMGGTPLHTKGIDAGESRAFIDIAGKPVYSWNSTNYLTTIEYDEVQRPVKIICQGGNLAVAHTLEKFVYGDKNSGLNKNLQLLQHFDQTGLVELERISFKGEALKSFKQFCKTYKHTINWDNLGDAELEEEQFRSSVQLDALGRAIHSVAPDGSISKPVFNFSGQLTKVQLDLHGKGSFVDYVEEIEYNEKGQRERIKYGNKTVTNYDYWDISYQLKSIHTTRGSGNEHLQWLYYWQDPSGNITSIQDDAQKKIFFKGEVVEAHNDYVYDSFYQLIEATGREHNGQNQPYSPLEEFKTPLVHKSDGQAMRAYTQQFGYDDAGNKELVKHFAVGNNWNRNFTYDDGSNRLIKSSVGSIDQNYHYDANGNMLRIQTADVLDWNFKNEISHLKRGTTEAWYNYDSSGQRCRKVVKEGITTKVRYYIGGFEVYREYENNNLKLERESLHVSDDTSRIALVETKTKSNGNDVEEILIRYQYGNHLGSASLELDEFAQVISYEEYYPYGNTSYQAVDKNREVPAKRYRYTGMERDEESGLNYHTARYYAPWLGRWLCPDPAGTVDGLNLYRYVRGNPINLSDPSGNAPPGDSSAGKYQAAFRIGIAELILASGNAEIIAEFLESDGTLKKIYQASHSSNIHGRTGVGQELSIEDASANMSVGSAHEKPHKPGTITRHSYEIPIGNGRVIVVEGATALRLQSKKGLFGDMDFHKAPYATGWTWQELDEQVNAARRKTPAPKSGSRERWGGSGAKIKGVASKVKGGVVGCLISGGIVFVFTDGGVEDALSSCNPLSTTTRMLQQEESFGMVVAAMGWDGLNFFTFGIPDLLLSMGKPISDPEVQEWLKKIERRYESGNGICPTCHMRGGRPDGIIDQDIGPLPDSGWPSQPSFSSLRPEDRKMLMLYLESTRQQ